MDMESRKRKELPSTSTDQESKRRMSELKDTIPNESPTDSVSHTCPDDDRFRAEEAHLTNLDKFMPELVKRYNNYVKGKDYNLNTCDKTPVYQALKVWENILGKLKKKDDIENCSNSSPYFGFVLKRSRQIEIVLPKVFLLLEQRYAEQKDESYKETNQQSIPWNRPANKTVAHPLTGFWKCRLICKPWNKAIQDLYLNEHELKFGQRQIGANSFDKIEQVNKFLQHFDSTHYDNLGSRKNPFMGRRLTLSYRWEGANREQKFFNRLIEMMTKYGQEIWLLNFSYYYLMTSNEMGTAITGDNHMIRGIIDFNRKFRKILVLAPNLKSINFDYTDFVRPFTNPTAEQLHMMGSRISANPFPKLAHLKSVNTLSVIGPILKGLLLRNTHIEELIIHDVKVFHLNDFWIRNIADGLRLKISFDSVEHFEHFVSLPFTFRPNELSFEYSFDDISFVSWSRIFTALNTKVDASMCTQLELHLPQAKTQIEKQLVLKESLSCRLNFSRLESVVIYGKNNFSLDFLLKSRKSLYSIQINKHKFYDNEFGELANSQIIQYLGYEKKFKESNILRKLPHLKILSIRNPYNRLTCFFNARQAKKINGLGNTKSFARLNTVNLST